ncbi:trypsin-1-like [Anabrus simplex]|uniref:trypsin-1-like n=1 Tax=Anabrus simplex TaxID=316456 RepID=UPI0035A37E41
MSIETLIPPTHKVEHPHIVKHCVLLCEEVRGQILPRPRLDGKIVGGSAASIRDFPYQLSLQLRGRHICGAAIISENWALTAAHCVAKNPASRLSLRAGTTVRGSGGTVHQASSVLAHPDFNPSTIDYDFALIRVASPFRFGPNVRAVALPSQNEVIPGGTKTVVTGWGATSEGGSVSDTLQKVILPIVPNILCNLAYNGEITDRMLCAGFIDGRRDACQGDSGGPLVANGKLHGIVSWGRGCARPTLPGVYARVARLRNWISSNSGV